MTSPTGKSTGKALRNALLCLAFSVAATTTLSALLFARVAADPELQPRPPLPVVASNFQLTENFERPVSYLGLVVAGRKANLGFEIPGQIASLPLRQGSPVTAGSVIASLDDSALQARRNATAAELKEVRTELQLARLKAQRQRDLRESGAVSREAYDETRLRAVALEARVSAVGARLESIDIEIQKSILRAPYDGVIADRHVNEGAIISPGAPVVRLIETSGKEAHIGVAAHRVAALIPGDDYQITLGEQVFEARLLSIRPDVDPLTRSTTVVFAIPEQVRTLDGEPLSLQLRESVKMKGGWLPLGALLEGKRGLWTVLRLEPEAGETYRTVREAVEVLESQGDLVYVRGTLADGALVVTAGVHRLTPGTLVRLAQEN